MRGTSSGIFLIYILWVLGFAGIAYLKVTLGAHTAGMHHTLWDFLPVELAKLLKKVIVLQKHRTCPSTDTHVSRNALTKLTVTAGVLGRQEVDTSKDYCTPLFPALRENSLLMTGAPVFVVSSFVLKFTDGMQGTFLSLQLPCEDKHTLVSRADSAV